MPIASIAITEPRLTRILWLPSLAHRDDVRVVRVDGWYHVFEIGEASGNGAPSSRILLAPSARYLDW